ncbi:MAG: Rv1355c family protein [Flavobacteriales bacterium]|nr:Rv1355c family protein [Flavobacteriales bacterium]
MIDEKVSLLIQNSKSQQAVYKPVFYRLCNSTDKNKFSQLIQENPKLTVFDELQGQLRELVKLQNPKINLTKEVLHDRAIAHLGNIPSKEYGVWVYYSWSNRLVHILDEEEFVTVRTNRNQYKITPEERTILAQKKIGVIGLSVGQSVAVTMSQERSYGEIRLADFDELELTNLNRIRTGVHNLGISKVIIVAREIAEIDPFLKVTSFNDGLTEENMEDFFLKGGKLDICVDECDSFAMKITLRLKAKELGIPIVMEASDKGTTDVERFDLELDRPILHGLIDHLDLEKAKKAKTNEEKIPYLLPMLGLDTTSDRMKASMLEIEQTITTWPQLASAVTLGGGVTADVCRRILLDQFHDSGRYFVDVEKLIGDTENAVQVQEVLELVSESTNKSDLLTDEEIKQTINNYDASQFESQLELDTETVETLIEAAITAPSGGNCQPWKYIWNKQKRILFLFFDTSRSLSLLDFENKASYLALGAASENLVLKAHALNLEVVLEKFPSEGNDKLVAVFRFFQKFIPEIESKVEKHDCDELEDAILKRSTNRTIGKRIEIDQKKLSHLRQIVKTIPGADLKILDNEQQILEMGEIMAKLDRILLTNKTTHQGFMKEIRWTPEEAEQTRDGVDIATIDLTLTEIAGFKMAKSWSVVKYLNLWKSGSAFEKLTRKSVAASSAIGLFTMPQYSSLDFYNGGRAVQRGWLAANQQNISIHPYFAAIAFFARLIHGKGEGMNENMIEEITTLRRQFVDLFSLDKTESEVFLVRLSIAEEPKVRSLRRPLKTVLHKEP